MIFTKINTSGTITYRIDLDSSIKTTYSTSTNVKVDNVTVAIALPFTTSLTQGVHTIALYLVGPTGSYTDSRYVVTDESLECKIITAISKMTDEQKRLDNTAYMWFLVREATTNEASGCLCSGDSIKTIYEDLKIRFADTCC